MSNIYIYIYFIKYLIQITNQFFQTLAYIKEKRVNNKINECTINN